MPTEPVNTVPYAVAMQEIDKIYVEEYEPIEQEFKENEEKGYNESPFTEAERAAYEDYQTLRAELKKCKTENFDTYNSAITVKRMLETKFVKLERKRIDEWFRTHKKHY